jgi:hypothetical protein
LDQGALGSCVGNATIGALGCDPFYNTLADKLADHPLTEDDAIEIYSEATKIDPFPGEYPPIDQGTSGLAGAKAAKQAGLISGYRHAFSLADALAALQETPVITGIAWWSSFETPDPDGLVAIAPGAEIRGGHEIAAIGYDADKGRVWFKQSWGPSWGVKGTFCMTAETWGQLLADKGDVTVLVPLSQPAPTPTPDPGAAPFQVSSQVASRVSQVAGHRQMTGDQWLEDHLRRYFGIPR